MKADLVRKYLPPSPATPKGRMKRPRKGIQSTQKNEAGRKLYENMAQEEPTIILEDKSTNKQNGTLYTDATSTLPEMSLDGHQYYFVAYDYDTN